MKQQELVSMLLKSAAYDEKARVLEIEFKTGGRYRYNDVPPSLYEELTKSEKPKEYFREYIKGGGYDCEKIR